MSSENKPSIPTTVKPRPAGTIVIQPGEDEAEAFEKLRQENEAKTAPPVKPTASNEDEHHE